MFDMNGNVNQARFKTCIALFVVACCTEHWLVARIEYKLSTHALEKCFEKTFRTVCLALTNLLWESWSLDTFQGTLEGSEDFGRRERNVRSAFSKRIFNDSSLKSFTPSKIFA